MYWSTYSYDIRVSSGIYNIHNITYNKSQKACFVLGPSEEILGASSFPVRTIVDARLRYFNMIYHGRCMYAA